MTRKNWRKFTLALFLVMAIGGSLWFAAPVSALTVDITDPAPPLLGTTIYFTVTVNIEDSELLPIQKIDLEIYKADQPGLKASCSDLPLATGTKSYSTAGGLIEVTATANWGYGYGYGYATWEEGGYSTGYSFGYGYGYGPGPSSITYNIRWVSSVSWPSGTYTIETKITADGTTFTKTKSVYFGVAGGGGGGGGGGADETPPDIYSILASNISKTGVDVGWLTNEMSTSQVEYWASEHKLSPLDEQMVTQHTVKLTGLMPATTYHYQVLSKDEAGNLATSDEYAFTTLGIPAAFSVTALEIAPAEVIAGKEVTISVLVTNTGEATGTYDVTLKIDNVTVATEKVTLPGGSSRKVSFTSLQQVVKTCSVTVNQLSGSFVVKAAPVVPSPTPTPTPPVQPPAPKPINWWLIAGIIVLVVAAAVFVWQTVIRRRAQ